MTRGAVSQKRCVDLLDALEGTAVDHLTIHQCERVIREIERQKCDSFLEQAESYLKKVNRDQEPRPRPQTSFWASLCGVPP